VIRRFVDGVERSVVGRLEARLGDEIAAGQQRTNDYMLERLKKRHEAAIAQIGEEELLRRADARMREADERFWRMDYTMRPMKPRCSR
jgi:hypothetical protein